MKSNFIFRKIIVFNTLFFLCITTILPNLLIVLISFTQRDPEHLLNFNFTLANFAQAFSPIFLRVYINSMAIGVVTVLFCLLFGYPFAYFIYMEKSNAIKSILLIAIIIPFWTSSLIRTYSIIFILKLHGLLNNILLYIGIIDTPLNMLYDWGAVIFGFVYTLIPFMIIPIYLSLRKIDPALIEAAKDLGASKLRIFSKILLPLSYTGVVSGCSMVLLSSLGMFYLSDLLGGSKTVLIGNIIKNQFLLLDNWNLGGAISVLLYFIVIFWIMLQKENYKLSSYAGNR
ncbi:ABC transporter permease [Candidatus Bandiella euplotis]|uniref:ABC transporter permease n=1 Tax=Candidatus Bandiella euplotis TaxID=1664265 RepID=A0ABZ0UNI9_9RICK|nr:ABC transporter permease subunit [Candidatus Bandiella woodruffii]WPX96405.1 ABC transporter permease [Candidatus Bandiella woodruffii]